MRDSCELHCPHLLDPARIHRVDLIPRGIFKEYQLSPRLNLLAGISIALKMAGREF
jgi:hypothetical protein